MNRKRKIYEISNEDEVNIEKTTKRPPNNYDKRMNVKDISNDRLVDSKIVNEFKRKSQIKKKSSHIRFSNSKSKMNSSLKSKSIKEIDVYDQISFEEFHTDSGSSNSEESLKNASSVLFDVYSEIHEQADGNWLFRAMSRGLTGEPWYYDTLRAAIAQHIEDNSNKYKDFIVGNIEDYISKMRRNGVWSGNCEIQAFSEIYSVNVNIHELESTLEPSHKFINVRASDHPISLMYRNNDHYNSLNLKGSVIVTKHSKNKKEPKASKHIFESKIKAVDKNVNFAGEKADSYSENSLLSIFKYWQPKLNSNESTNNLIYPEGIHKQPYNKRKNEKRAFRSIVNYGKKYKVKTIVVDKNMKRDVLMKNWSFPSKKSNTKRWNIK